LDNPSITLNVYVWLSNSLDRWCDLALLSVDY